MSFWGLFKSKKEKEFEKLHKKLYSEVFPDGSEQSDREAKEVVDLLDNKYSIDLIEKIYILMAILFFLDRDNNKERVIKDTMRIADNKITRDDLLKIYTYVRNKSVKQLLGKEKGNMLEGMFNGIFGGNEGCDLDEIPGSFGDYGYSLTNPIPTKGIFGSEIYLDRLKSSKEGTKIKWERIGSFSSDNIEHPIDGYKLFNTSEDFIATIYISHYHQKNSNKAPDGFELC